MAQVEAKRHSIEGGRRETIVMLPANRRGRLLAKSPDLANRLGVAEAIEAMGYRVDYLDVHDWPLNPFARRPSLFASIDPLRAADVLLRRRRAAAVVSYYQSGVLLVLGLREFIGFRPSVVIVDIGDDQNWPLRERIVRFCIKRADAVFTFASEQAARLRSKYGVGSVGFLPQQVDTVFYAPGDGPMGDYVLTVGGDVSRDFDTLKRAVAGLGAPVVLRTPLKIEPWDATVTIVRERLSDARLRELYRRARIVVLPLHDMLHPGGITTLLEAFACGKAVVAANSRGISDYLRSGDNCLAVPCGDVAAMRNAIARLLDDEALAERLGRNARAYAEMELSQTCHAQRLVAAIRSLKKS